MKRKPDQQAPHERLVHTEELLLKGHRHGQIERKLGEQYQVTGRTIRNYIKRVYDEWSERAKADPRNETEYLRGIVLGVLHKATEAGEHKVVLQAVDRLARLSGAYVDRTEHTGAGGAPIQVALQPPDLSTLTDEELENLKRIYAKLPA